jgi:hypothetical protein
MLARIITLTAITVLAISSTAMARGGGGGGGGGKGGSGAGHFHGHFGNHFRFGNRFRFDNRFLKNQALLNGWGWGWGWGGYGDNGYGNTTIVAFPQAVPQLATGSTSSGPCHWNDNTVTVPSSAGGTRQVSVVSCQSGQPSSETEGASSNK